MQTRVQATKTEIAPSRAAVVAGRAPLTASARTPLWVQHLPLQAKLTVNQPGDIYEQEADRVAAQVMRMPDPAAGVVRRCACGGVADESGECPACRAKRLGLQRQSDAAGGMTAPPSVHATLRAPGQPLDGGARAFMESRFGQDFGGVRVHTDSGAAASARAVGAQAYTVGQNVVFGEGRYAPGTAAGNTLLAHELAHVVQQGGGAATVQRVVAPDFQVTQIAPQDAANPGMIFFEIGGTTIPASEMPKIAPLATPAGQNLTLNGFSDEVGSAAANDAMITTRLNAVDAALAAAGHTAARAKVNLRTSGIGQIDYRHMRSVEVMPTPTGLAAAPSAQPACAGVGAEIAPCGTAFTASWPEANAAMIKADADLTAGTPAAVALKAVLFSGVPFATVQTKISALKAQVGALPGQHQCHNSCDSGCTRPAYNSGTGIGPAGAKMTLCPDFLGSSDKDWQARLLIHESAHGTAGLSAEDIAYGNTRLISFLTPADQERNTDSYVLLAWLLYKPGSVAIGPATPDATPGMTAPETVAARRAVAWVESWLNYGQFDTSILYDTASRSVPPAPAWNTSRTGDAFNIETMHLLAPIFGLTDPGPAAPFTQPTADDKPKLAGIHDRFDQMYKSVNWQVVTINKGAPGSDAWQSHGATLPRLGQIVTVGPLFFKRTPVAQVKHLVLLMATAMSGISPAFRQKYVDAIDAIRLHRTLGP